jgi:putative hydrolase of the HAD superfamily
MGTLIELEPPGPRLRAELRERAGVEISEAEARAAMGAEIGFYRARHLLGHDRPSLAALRRECAAALRDALPTAARDLPLPVVRDALLSAIRFRPYPDAMPALEQLRHAGVRRVVVSNWDISLHDVLRRTGLASLVSGAITSAELGATKPSLGPFQHALTIAGIPARDALMVGNSVEDDVAGAQRARVSPVLIVREGDAPPGLEGVPVIRSLSELPALVA